ncbi:MAG TPA: hypothetical protein VGF49_07055 [Candidatus Solibacter sp.]
MRLAFLTLIAVLCHAAEPAEGRWEGTIQIPGTGLTAIVDLAQSAGGWIGSATVPGFAKGAPLADIVVRDSAVSFTLKGALGDPKFNGRVEAGAFDGNFLQAGNSAAFHLRHAGPPQVDLPRQSTAVGAELAGDWLGEVTLGGNKLKATLKLTNQPGGAATAQFVITGKRVTNVPIDLVRQEGDFLTVVSSQYRISFEGRFQKDSGELTGTFAQGPIEDPLTFRRAQ